MNKKRATEILKDEIDQDDGLFSADWCLSWDVGDTDAELDGVFTADELEAIAWRMKNKS